MAESLRKYAVTQEEVDRAVLEGRPQRRAAPEATGEAHAWNLSSNGSDLIGIHIRGNESYVIALSKKLDPREKVFIKAGYDTPEKLLIELTALSEKIGTHLPTVVTLSGKHSPFLISKAPNVNRAMVAKALKIQLRASCSEDLDEIAFTPLPLLNADPEKAQDYIVSGITTGILDRTLEILRKARFRLQGWDTDTLCYARATSFLWQKNGLGDGTRLSIVIGANRCRLVLLGSDGRMVAPLIPLGISSFMEHLASALGEPVLTPGALEANRLTVLETDSQAVREQKLCAIQAIYTLYVPLAQQIKMNLYKACNDTGIPFPSYFSVIGSGARLFRIAENLEVDLGIDRVPGTESLEGEWAGALGAALWDRHPVHLNLLPGGGEGIVQRVKESVQMLRGRLVEMAPKGSLEKLSKLSLKNQSVGRTATVGLCLLGLLALYPVWNRWRISGQLDSKKRELDSLGTKKDKVAEASNRQSMLDRKLVLKKQLESKRTLVSPVFKDVLTHLPSSIKLTGISLRDSIVTLKGRAETQGELESFLELCTNLKYVGEPSPLSIRREGGTAVFEIALKVK